MIMNAPAPGLGLVDSRIDELPILSMVPSYLRAPAALFPLQPELADRSVTVSASLAPEAGGNDKTMAFIIGGALALLWVMNR